MVPMPVSTEPDGARASICQPSDPLSPLDCDGFQLTPAADVHTATFCRPGGPNNPAAVKPAASAVSAAKPGSGPGGLNGTRCQAWPPPAAGPATGPVPAPPPAPAAARPTA